MQNYITIISSLSPILVIIYLAWKEYRSGDSELKRSIQADYETHTKQLEQKVADLQEEHKEHTKDIVRLQTLNEEKDKRIAEYKEIFANRNPDLTAVLDEIKEFMRLIHLQNKHQTDILEQRQQRDKLIDEASKKHTGALMRAPTNGEELPA